MTLLLDSAKSFSTESANVLSSSIDAESRIDSLTSTSNSVKNMQYICGAFQKLLCDMQK